MEHRSQELVMERRRVRHRLTGKVKEHGAQALVEMVSCGLLWVAGASPLPIASCWRLTALSLGSRGCSSCLYATACDLVLVRAWHLWVQGQQTSDSAVPSLPQGGSLLGSVWKCWHCKAENLDALGLPLQHRMQCSACFVCLPMHSGNTSWLGLCFLWLNRLGEGWKTLEKVTSWPTYRLQSSLGSVEAPCTQRRKLLKWMHPWCSQQIPEPPISKSSVHQCAQWKPKGTYNRLWVQPTACPHNWDFNKEAWPVLCLFLRLCCFSLLILVLLLT
jgi:hypothetical protein